MYNPPSFAVEDPAEIRALLEARRFGHLVAVDDDGVPASIAVPFLLDHGDPLDAGDGDAGDGGGDGSGGREGGLRAVRAHLARANPFWRLADGRRALLIVAGTDGYVSPRWYPSKAVDPKVVPTWDYEVVHVHGRLHALHDDAARHAVVAGLTEHFEAAEGGPVWSLHDAPADYLATMLRGIVGIELRVERVEAKRKLSQNRPEADAAGVVTGLRAATGTADDAARHRLADAVAQANRTR